MWYLKRFLPTADAEAVAPQRTITLPLLPLSGHNLYLVFFYSLPVAGWGRCACTSDPLPGRCPCCCMLLQRGAEVVPA